MSTPTHAAARSSVAMAVPPAPIGVVRSPARSTPESWADIPGKRQRRKATSATPSPPGPISLTEGDPIVGRGQGSVIGTLVERRTRTIRLLHLASRDADTLHATVISQMSDLPAKLVRSITWDQGIEMARHLRITAELGAPVYFCDAHAPWQQRGSHENSDGLLRQQFPNGHRPEDLLPPAPPRGR